jgi:hypothetical protein
MANTVRMVSQGSRILILCLFLTVCLATQAQKKDGSVVLNHFLIVVDSATYKAALNSEFLNEEFAFAREKKLKMWEGFYIVGEDNYIELFHQNSYYGEILPIGDIWICHASLKANSIKDYNLKKTTLIDYSSNESFDELSFYTIDSSNLMTTQEMNQLQYESWVKKRYHDSLTFETVDYNSPAEVDSSKSYLFKNVSGIQLEVNSRDSVNITRYLSIIGYAPTLNAPGKLTFSNSIDFVELIFSNDVEGANVSVIYFELRKQIASKSLTLGNSEMVIEGNKGRWIMNKPMHKINN